MAKNLNPNNIEVGDFVQAPLHPAKGSGYEDRVWKVTAVMTYGGCILALVGGMENDRKAAVLTTVKLVEKGKK